MDADDLGRMFGWEFSLMIATIRIINSGLLDDLPDLRIQFSHFSGGIGRYRGRYNGFQQRTKWGTSQIKGHNRQPKLAVDYYLDNRLYYDCAGWAGPEPCGPLGAHWVKFGLQELALSQCVFATDYPQAIRDPGEAKDYVEAVALLDPNARALVHGLNAEKLIPNIKERVAKRN
jgi:predicted TIM-barrel fold metal-dependent hydrolase